MTEPVAFRRVYGLESYSRTSGESNHHRQSVSDTRVPRYQLHHEDDWRTFGFPSRMLRRRVSQEDVDAFTAKCDALRQSATEQEQRIVVSCALENSWTVTLRFFSVQRQMALARSFVKPERQLHFANSPN